MYTLAKLDIIILVIVFLFLNLDLNCVSQYGTRVRSVQSDTLDKQSRLMQSSYRKHFSCFFATALLFGTTVKHRFTGLHFCPPTTLF